jgi:hypothetical protein
MAKDEDNQDDGQSGHVETGGNDNPRGGNEGPGGGNVGSSGPDGDHGQGGGQNHQVKKERISYDELVALSGEPLPTGPDPGFTITYFNGPNNKPEGTVMKDKSVKVVDGMVFNVTPTNRS